MKNHLHLLKIIIVMMLGIVCNNTLFAQSGEKWSFAGNSPSGNAAVGTNNWFPVVFKSNNTPYMWLTPAGNLGIGFSNPTVYKLDVNGRVHATGNVFADSSITTMHLYAVQKVTADALQVNNLAVFGNVITVDGANSSISSSAGLLNFGSNNLFTTGVVNSSNILNLQSTVNNQQSEIDTLQSSVSSQQVEIDTLQSTVGNIQSSQWQNNGSDIFYNFGRVGVGTDAPAAKLDVWGSQRITENLFVGGELTVSDKFSAKTVTTDTAVATKQLLVNHNLLLGRDIGSVKSDIASKVEVLKIQSDPAAIYDVAISADNSSKVGIGTKFPTEKLSVDGNMSVSGNITTAGNISSNAITSNSIQTSQLAISDKLESDTIHARKEFLVNSSLKVAKETANSFAEVSTVDTAVTLVLQKEEAAQVVIGPAPVTPAPTPLPGQVKDKLTVIGNTLLQGNANVSGTVNANTISANNMNVSYTSFDSLQVLSKIRTNRIAPLPGDSLIHFGDSSVVLNLHYNSITWGKTLPCNGCSWVEGLAIGNGYKTHPYWFPIGWGLNSIAIGAGPTATMAIGSIAIGTNIWSDIGAVNSVTIGAGIVTHPYDFGAALINYKRNSFMVGFNSNKPTFYVGPSSGAYNSVGNVGIGTTDPKDLLQVGDSYNKLAFGGLGSNVDLGWSTSYIGFNAVRNNATSQWEFCADGNPSNWSHNAGGVITQNIGGGMIFIPIQTDATNAIRTMSDADLYSKRVMEIYPWESASNLGSVKVNGTVFASSVKVDGTVFARRFKVTLGSFYDYVFDKEYQLTSIDSLEKFIQQNKHLPDIPSQKEVLANGLDIGEFNSLLLKKIEELTLYIIDLKKENEQLKNRISIIENK